MSYFVFLHGASELGNDVCHGVIKEGGLLTRRDALYAMSRVDRRLATRTRFTAVVVEGSSTENTFGGNQYVDK